MTENSEDPGIRRPPGHDPLRRLDDHDGFPARARRNRIARRRLEDHEPVGYIDRFPGLVRQREILVEVRAGQRDDEQRVRPFALEAHDRVVAALGVQSDEHVAGHAVPGLGDRHVTTELAQDPFPAQRGDAVPGPRPGRSRRDEHDSHSGPPALEAVSFSFATVCSCSPGPLPGSGSKHVEVPTGRVAGATSTTCSESTKGRLKPAGLPNVRVAHVGVEAVQPRLAFMNDPRARKCENPRRCRAGPGVEVAPRRADQREPCREQPPRSTRCVRTTAPSTPCTGRGRSPDTARTGRRPLPHVAPHLAAPARSPPGRAPTSSQPVAPRRGSRARIGRPSPHGNRRFGTAPPAGAQAPAAAASHSASVGSRRPAQRQYASASNAFTWTTARPGSSGTQLSKARRIHRPPVATPVTGRPAAGLRRRALVAPELAPRVAAVVDELRELALRDRRARDRERRDRDVVRPLLVVEHERRGPFGSEPHRRLPELDVARGRRRRSPSGAWPVPAFGGSGGAGQPSVCRDYVKASWCMSCEERVAGSTALGGESAESMRSSTSSSTREIPERLRTRSSGRSHRPREESRRSRTPVGVASRAGRPPICRSTHAPGTTRRVQSPRGGGSTTSSFGPSRRSSSRSEIAAIVRARALARRRQSSESLFMWDEGRPLTYSGRGSRSPRSGAGTRPALRSRTKGDQAAGGVSHLRLERDVASRSSWLVA